MTQEQKHEHFANVDNHDGYTVRLFALDLTDRCPAQVKVKGYAQTAHIKKIRKNLASAQAAAAAAAAAEGRRLTQ